MSKRVLMVATVPSMIGQFNMNNINLLLDMGYQVDVASNFSDTSIWPLERVQKLKEQLKLLNVNCFQLDFSRNPLKISHLFHSYKEAIELINERHYSFIHTHTPVASAIIRKAAHKTGTKVIYTAHGFHFYDGAPLLNWILFYPIEKHYSKYTDVLITINKEDYGRAIKFFKAKKTIYIPGVGVDTGFYKFNEIGRSRIRNELNLDDNRIMLLSVGELNKNKNHESVIRAIKDSDYTYVIVGKGILKDRLESVAKACNVDLRLMGYRTDVVDFYSAADVYVLPSIREGLNVSLMEAMSCGLPVACGKIRGNTDLVSDCLFNPINDEEIRNAIHSAISNRKEFSQNNTKSIKSYDLINVQTIMRQVYKD